jgi:hypothetical protein
VLPLNVRKFRSNTDQSKESKGSFYENASICSSPADNDNVPEISKPRPEMPVL